MNLELKASALHLFMKLTTKGGSYKRTQTAELDAYLGGAAVVIPYIAAARLLRRCSRRAVAPQLVVVGKI